LSSPKIEIVNPIRFFSFFGLFLIFLFLAFRSCSDHKEGVKYVQADNLSETQAADLKKANTEELSDFISDVKKDLKKTDQVKDKDLSAEQLAALEDKNATAKKVKTALAKKKVEVRRKADLARRQMPAKKPISPSKQNIIVKTQNGKLSSLSKQQLRKTIGNAGSQSFSNIKIYGYYGMNQQKGKAYIKAADIKNTLIDLGVKRSVPIYMLTEQTRLPNAMGKVIFSQ